MHILHVHVHVKPEHLDAFQTATVENASHSVQEPGCARFDVIQQADDPTRFVLVEIYRDAQALAAHRETPHYHALDRARHGYAGRAAHAHRLSQRVSRRRFFLRCRIWKNAF
jgi:quinol monooxygenase YgiN